MTPTDRATRHHVRTLLEAKIRERNMTLEEFAEHAETVARNNPDAGTLSYRHLQRLVAGTEPERVRPATRRLLESIFEVPANDLLRPISADDATETEGRKELDRLIENARRVDGTAIQLFADQIDIIRKIDRRFGAATLLESLRRHAQHLEELLNHSTDGRQHRALAAVLTDAHTLAGWQSLDRGEIRPAWGHYGRALEAARAAESPALLAHALAEQAVVLADIGRSPDAARMSNHARTVGADGPRLLRSWLAAAHGEALAANGQRDASLRAFEDAHRLLPDTPARLDDGPYLALDPIHLARWRGHALAQFGHPDAITVLTQALAGHDSEFTRAEAGLRTDLVLAHLAIGELDAAQRELTTATRTAATVGSVRLRHRLDNARDALAS